MQLQHVAPAHTDSDILVHLPDANILHTGDIFFNGFYPAIAYSTNGWIGGVVSAEDRAMTLCDAHTQVVPGHGPVGTLADLKAAREMLTTIQGRLEQMLNQEKSVEEIVVAMPTRDFDARWGKGFYDGAGFSRLAVLESNATANKA